MIAVAAYGQVRVFASLEQGARPIASHPDGVLGNQPFFLPLSADGHRSVQTPCPGTETWLTESRRLTTLDYRLFDVQHAVLPTRLPLHQFYSGLVRTQRVLARKHLGFAALAKTTGIVARQLARGQTNFARMI